MKRSFTRIMVLAAAVATASGCTEGKRPFRMVQFCLANTNEIPDFIKFMREIADNNQMSFYDRSSDTHQELRSLRSNNKNVPLNDRTVNVGAQHANDFSFGAGNLGMPTDQIVIGFNGNNMKEARAFANSAVVKISRRWTVKEVATGKGAFPLPDCD